MCCSPPAEVRLTTRHVQPFARTMATAAAPKSRPWNAAFWDMDPPPRQETPERQAQAGAMWWAGSSRTAWTPWPGWPGRPRPPETSWSSWSGHTWTSPGWRTTSWSGGRRTCWSELGGLPDANNDYTVTTASRSTRPRERHARTTPLQRATTHFSWSTALQGLCTAWTGRLRRRLVGPSAAGISGTSD